MGAYPDEVVEAAARALHEAVPRTWSHSAWDSNHLSDCFREEVRTQARHALDNGYVPPGWGVDSVGNWRRLTTPAAASVEEVAEKVAAVRRYTDDRLDKACGAYQKVDAGEALDVALGCIIDVARALTAELRAGSAGRGG